MKAHTFLLSTQEEVLFLGPDGAAGPLPALFYFALSAKDSLLLDPIHQPAAYLTALPLRIFSLTLPGHANNFPGAEALNIWAQEISQGRNCVQSFVTQVARAVEELGEAGLLQKDRLAVAGLSRGAFMATHVAAAMGVFKTLLGFAPLTQLSFCKEFKEMKDDPRVTGLNLEHLVAKLIDRKVRFYIGNVDTRVGTRRCFDFIEKLSLTAYHHKIRSPAVELILSPSIGHQGHGTSHPIFHAGAQWVAEQLGVLDVL